jgi:isocitrate dehydrogenase
VLFSLHLKATMMKVSDPIIFGHAVSVFSPTCSPSTPPRSPPLGVDPNNGIGDLGRKIERSLPEAQRARSRPTSPPCTPAARRLAMVDSDKGITNLHVPSDVIVDASMPAMIRDSRPDVERGGGSCRTPSR